ncbi:class I SAM-dependent DNA methyltransferase [uncultured Cyclobacterium sp.]|uniref:type I restriction-modification system subunit M n=1 Tax=uncultured Cyclobacterium sp. TaxID=453820 RepID=UPI0030ED51C1|tara:strand:- start:26366 stop:27841 length:1476 start_codon:yes stop_codon:yes gene_type:complete
MTTNNLIAKIWSFCDTLRDDGVSYSDYLEQLTFLLFLKMADEYEKGPQKRKSGIPEKYNWDRISSRSGGKLEAHYVELLRELGKEPGMLGQIFTKAQNKIQDPAKLDRLVKMIDKESWVSMDADIKGDMYEGLLEKNAQDTKSGAGQYFTPRDLITAIVECVRPEPKKTIADPACGTGGFFLSAYDFLTSAYKLDKDEKRFLKEETFAGWEIVASTARMALMNLFLHNIGDINGQPPIRREDALLQKPSDLFDYVLANPPFGKKSSVTITNAEGKEEKEDLLINRNDFWVTTTNKQLNFLQHIVSMLKTTGKAAVVLPDNVLFEGGVGETVRKKLMEKAELHTILRLPTGIFYAHGVKANVLFFDAKPASKDIMTKEVWFYDYRTNISHTLKKSPLKFENLKDFVDCYNPKNRNERKETWSEQNPEGRWRKYTYDEILARDKTSLDIFWLRDENMLDLENLPDPDILALEIIENIESALDSFREVALKIED